MALLVVLSRLLLRLYAALCAFAYATRTQPRPLKMSSGLFAMGPTLFAFYISKDVDWTDEHNIFMLRVLFGVSLVIQALAGYFVQLKVQARNDLSPINVPAAA